MQMVMVITYILVLSLAASFDGDKQSRLLEQRVGADIEYL